MHTETTDSLAKHDSFSLFDDGCSRVIDSRAMPWTAPPPGAPFHGTATKTKVLARTSKGWPIVQLLTRSPGAASSQAHGRPERHYHRTVREWVYIYSGRLSYREFTDITDVEGTPISYLEGYFLDRQPGPNTWHGIDPDRGSEGYVGLEFRPGPGLGSPETAHKEEHVSALDDDIRNSTAAHVDTDSSPRFGRPYPQADAVIYGTDHVRLIDSRAVTWNPASHHPMSVYGTVHVRPLSEDDSGVPLFEAVHLRADAAKTSGSRTVGGREAWVVLSGEAVLELNGMAIELKPGCFVDLAAGTEYQFGPQSLASVGIELLVWNMALALHR